MARNWNTLGAMIGCFVLLANVEKGMSADFQCYNCTYFEYNGQFEDYPEFDVNCKSSPQLTSTVPCKRGCVLIEYTQNYTYFGMEETTAGIGRICADNLADFNGISPPNPGTCLKDDAFETWLNSVIAAEQPTGQPMGPMEPGQQPMGPGYPTPFPLGSIPPFGTIQPFPTFGTIPPFPLGTIPPGFLGTQNPFEGSEGLFEMNIDGSVCTCTSDFCLKDTSGETGSSAGMRPAYIMLVTGVTFASLLSKLMATV